MAEFHLEFEWTDPLGARGEELRATWARLRILVGDSPVTRVYDRGAMTVRDGVYVPLYPLAEWLATHWWVICHELGTPERAGLPDYRFRHSLLTAREGYSFPAMSFHPLGEAVCLTWDRSDLPSHGIEFLTSGRQFVALADFKQTVADFVDRVVRRLNDFGVPSTLLQEEWSAITDTTPEEEEYCQAAAALGCDPYELHDGTRDAIIRTADDVPPSLRHEFFAAARLSDLAKHAHQLSRAMAETAQNDTNLPTLRGLRQNGLHFAPTTRPWEQGWSLAQGVRTFLGIGDRPTRTFQDLSVALRTDPLELDRVVLQAESDKTFFDAVVGTNKVGSPVFVVRPRAAEAKLFHFCRGLLEYIVARDRTPSLVTRTVSDRQSRNRAFAAELLAPSAALRSVIQRTHVSMDDVEDLANHFGVSYYVILHQLENHQIASVSDEPRPPRMSGP